jgi:hypothetical protein
MNKISIFILFFFLVLICGVFCESINASSKKHFYYGPRLLFVNEKIMNEENVNYTYMKCPGLMFDMEINNNFGFLVSASQSLYDKKFDLNGEAKYFSTTLISFEGYFKNNLFIRKLLYSISFGPALIKIATRKVIDAQKENFYKPSLTLGFSIKYLLSKRLLIYLTNVNFIMPREKESVPLLGRQYLRDPKLIESFGLGISVIF